MTLSEKLLLLAARRSTETSLGWAHPDCETLQEASRIARGDPVPELDGGPHDAVLAQNGEP